MAHLALDTVGERRRATCRSPIRRMAA